MAGMEVEEEQELQAEPPPASGDQEEAATMDPAGELRQPKPLKQEGGATLPVVPGVSNLPGLLSGTRTRVLLWEGDLMTEGPVCGEPNLSQECLDLQEVSNAESCID